MPKEISGIAFETVSDIIGEEPPPPVAIQPFQPTTLEGTRPLPEPGIYFGMPEEEYLSIPALSASGIKQLTASPMIFYSRCDWLSERCRRKKAEAAQDEKLHRVHGKAYHARILEGAQAFRDRFVVELDPADYPESLVSTDQIKAAIMRHTETVPVKPCSARKDELAAQLEQLRSELADPPGIVVGLAPTSALKVDDLKAAIGLYHREQPVKPWAKVTDTMPDTGEEYQRSAVKEDWVRQLLELDPDAQVFHDILGKYLAQHTGKTVLSLDAYEQIEIAARMIERDPELKDAFCDGHPEVTLIWYCERTGVPMKLRADYLKLAEIVDLKSVGNQRERSIENAIRFEISGWHYNFQPVVYFEGVQAVRKLVRESDRDDYPVFVHLDGAPKRMALGPQVSWVLKWSKVSAPDEWLWVFQQKGDAPITRGVRFPRTGITHQDTEFLIERAKRLFIQFNEVFGTEPWLDIQPIYTISDEDIPRQATEI